MSLKAAWVVGADPRFLYEKRSIPPSPGGCDQRGTASTTGLEMFMLLYSITNFKETHRFRGSFEDVCSLEQLPLRVIGHREI